MGLGSGLGPNRLGWALEVGLILIGWVGPKVNGLDLRSGLGPNRLASRYEVEPNLMGLI